MSNECKICQRQVDDLRFGACFHCATAESIIAEGVDMYDKPIPKLEGYSEHMDKVSAILKLYKVKQPLNK